MKNFHRVAALLALPLAASGQPSSCSSDRVAQPAALLERFISADCDTCWADKLTPEPASGTLAIDWVTPGSRGEDAPLAAVATRDALARLESLKRGEPAPTASTFTPRTPDKQRLRVAHGLPVADYIGTSIEWHAAGAGAWKAWLLLVETLPAGTEGTAVERNLVRNVFTTEWTRAAPAHYELRPMLVPEGAQPSRLRVIGWVEDARGRMRAIAQSRCTSN